MTTDPDGAEPIAGPGPQIRRITAPNPSPMTHLGTNTYLVGSEAVAVIDPGPRNPAHLAAILAAIGPGRVSHILVTHAHLDHSGLAADLARATSAPVLGFGPAAAGRSERMQALADQGLMGGGEGVDSGFAPNRRLADGDRVTGEGWSIDVVHTPGHFSGHLSFAMGEVLFSGDHAMGWATTLISPPDGDVSAFLASCRRLLARTERRYLPGHGNPIERPAERLHWLVRHRTAREDQILAALTESPGTAAGLAHRIYTDTPPALHPAATRNVLAHLIDLTHRNRIVTADPVGPAAVYRLR